MTKSHILLYALTVLGITIGAYLYTSTVEAPHGLTIEETNGSAPELPDKLDTPTPTAPEVPKASAPEEQTSRSPTNTPSLKIIDRTWQWSYNRNAAGQKIFIPKRSEAFRMQFASGRMSSATDCNTVGGVYTISGDSLSFGPLMSTLMFCEGSEELEYHTSLGLVSGFEINDSELYLKNDQGEVMVFVAIEL
jgi:heat shock protein HslJ